MTNDFTSYLKNKSYSKSTVRHYTRFTEVFLEYTNQSVEKIESQDLLNYIAYLQKQGHSPRYINERLGAIRHYMAYQIQQGVRDHNPLVGLFVRGQRHRLPHNLLEYATLEQLLSDYQGSLQHKVILSLLVNQGLHSADLPTIEANDIDLEKGQIRLKGSGKTAARRIALEVSQVLLLHQYLQRQPAPLFPSGSTLANRMSQLTKELRRYCPPIKNSLQIRSSVISHWLKSEGLRQVQYKAGHKYISSTERYQQAQLEELQANLRKYHPLNQKKSE